MELLPNKISIFFMNLGKSLQDFRSKYPSLFITLILLVGISIVLGIMFNFTTPKLIKDENKINSQPDKKVQTYFEGKVSYVSKIGNNISYELKDLSGNVIASLQSDDAKLQLVEGLYVKIYGELIEGSGNQKDTLIVKEVILQNGSN